MFREGRTVSEISEILCEDYAASRGVAVGTIRKELGVLRAAVNHAYKKARTLASPVHVELPPEPPSKDEWLLRGEAAALLRASLRSPKVRPYLPLFIVMGLHTGRRKEQILSLRWPQVDLDGQTIDWELPGREQTNKRKGRSRIPDSLLPHLVRARERGSELGYVINRDGKRVGDPKKAFKAACIRAGLKPYSPHIMKHTRTTWGMQAGVDVWELAGFLGTSVETLLKTYGHHHPDYQSDAANRVKKSPQNVRKIRHCF